MNKAFLDTRHRPFPLPDKKWLMTQTWENLLFCHWPVEYDVIRQHVPAELELDTYEGRCWIGIIPFQVNKMRLRKMPPVPYLRTYLELNVRTYVSYKGVPGVYFFTLDADKSLAVLGGKVGALLPYREAKIKMTKKRGFVHFESDACGPDWMKGKLKLHYQPVSRAYSPSADSLEYWLFERYCFFTIGKKNIYRGDIHHTRWKIEQANVLMEEVPSYLNDIATHPPVCHYSHKKQAFMWMLSKL